MMSTYKAAPLFLVIASLLVLGCSEQPSSPALNRQATESSPVDEFPADRLNNAEEIEDDTIEKVAPARLAVEKTPTQPSTDAGTGANTGANTPSEPTNEPAASKAEPAKQVARQFTRPTPPSDTVPEKGEYKLKPSTLIIPSDPNKVVRLTFNDIKLDMKADVVFEESMLSETVKKLDGRKVKITGFIFEGILQQKGIKKFPLLKNTKCLFGPGGQAYHIIDVELNSGVTANFTNRPVAVEGIFTIKPWKGPDGNTWVLYHLQGSSVR